MTSKKSNPAGRKRIHNTSVLQRYRWQIIISSVLILLATLIAVNAIMPRVAAERYNQSIAQPVSDVRAAFIQLQKSSDLSTDMLEPDKAKAAEAKLRADIASAREAIDQLEMTNLSLGSAPLSYGNEAYHEAAIAKRERTYLVGQSRAILQHYEDLINHLAERNAAQAVVSGHLDAFNAVTDLSTLAGQAETMRSRAVAIEGATEKLEAIGPIPGTTADTTQQIKTYRLASAGFLQLAGALEQSDAAAVQAAVQQLESATQQMYASDTVALTTAVQHSATLREIRTLVEKLPLSRE